MKTITEHFRAFCVAWLALLALGCGPRPQTSTPVPRSERFEASVHPGINAPYYQANALATYSRIFEAESREVVARRDDIIQSIGLSEGMAVADVGAGTGFFTTELAKRVGGSGTVFAVDIVQVFLHRIQERVDDEHLTNVIIVEGTERATNLPPESVDLVFMCDTYHHIEYPHAYMRSVLATLRPGGTLVLIDFERIVGTTHPRVLEHVRANKQAVIDEVTGVGFVLQAETHLLERNYILRFGRAP